MARKKDSSDKPAEDTPAAKWPPPNERDFKGVMARINRDGWKALSILSTELDRPLQQMMVEALNDYLVKHGRKPVIETRAVPRN